MSCIQIINQICKFQFLQITYPNTRFLLFSKIDLKDGRKCTFLFNKATHNKKNILQMATLCCLIYLILNLFYNVVFTLIFFQYWNTNKLLIKNYLEHQGPYSKSVNHGKPCHVSEKQRNYLVINLIMEHWSKWCHPLTPVTLSLWGNSCLWELSI